MLKHKAPTYHSAETIGILEQSFIVFCCVRKQNAMSLWTKRFGRQSKFSTCSVIVRGREKTVSVSIFLKWRHPQSRPTTTSAWSLGHLAKCRCDRYPKEIVINAWRSSLPLLGTTTCNGYANKSSFTLFSQNGKALCDRYISVSKAKIIDFVNSGGNARDVERYQMRYCLFPSNKMPSKLI